MNLHRLRPKLDSVSHRCRGLNKGPIPYPLHTQCMWCRPLSLDVRLCVYAFASRVQHRNYVSGQPSNILGTQSTLLSKKHYTAQGYSYTEA